LLPAPAIVTLGHAFDSLFLLVPGVAASPVIERFPQSSAGPAPKPVEITRDNFGVPHVFGATAAAVMFGSGYAMAEDRLADIEVTLRRANGRLAAIEGRRGLDGAHGHFAGGARDRKCHPVGRTESFH